MEKVETETNSQRTWETFEDKTSFEEKKETTSHFVFHFELQIKAQNT